MSTRRTAPAEASSPDADRAGPNASADLPAWLVHVLAVLAFLAQRWALATGRRPAALAWIHDRPDLPPGSAQAVAASVRGAFGNAIAWMCRRRGIGPGHPDWPELSRAIVRFGGSLNGFRAGQPACGLLWWENPEIISGMIGMATPTPAADAMALLLSRQAAADAPPPALHLVQADDRPAVAPAPCRLVFARTARVRRPDRPPAGTATNRYA
jgi:hypothetical protein